MTLAVPQFELRRVFDDGTEEEPLIVPLADLPADMQINRRDFLATGLTGAAALALLGGGSARGDRTGSSLPGKRQVPVAKLKAHHLSISSVAFDPGGRLLASAADELDVKVWILPAGKLHQAQGKGGPAALAARPQKPAAALRLRVLAATPDGQLVFRHETDRSLALLSLPDLKSVGTLVSDQALGEPTALACSADGLFAASGHEAGSVALWSLRERRLALSKKGHDGRVNALALCPGSLLSAGDDGVIHVWDLPGLTRRTTLAPKEGRVLALAAAPDGKSFASGAGKTIRLWSLPQGRPLAVAAEHAAPVSAIVATPDGRGYASASWDETIRLWSPDGKPRGVLKGQGAPLEVLAISTDGRLLASGDFFGTIVLWDLAAEDFMGFLFDPAVNETSGLSYNVFDRRTGRTITYTLPCGSPIPSGAVCVCNCVPGTYRSSPYRNVPTRRTPYRYTPTRYGTRCTCNKICTCVPVRIPRYRRR